MRIKHHISGLYKKILTPIGVLVFLVVGVVFVYGINTWDSGYRVYHNNTFVSVQGGNNGALTKRVKSTCTVGDSIFIPTSGYAEWDGPNGFLNKKPSCVTIGCKTNSECKGGEICQGYVAATTSCQGTTSDINTACARSSLTGTFGSAKIAQDVCNVLTTNGPVRAKYGILATGSDFGHPGYIFGLQVGGGTSSWESNCYTERSNLCKQLTKYPDSGTFSFSMNPHIASYSLSTNQCGSQYSVVSNYVNSTYKNILSHIECTLPTPSAPVACSTITSPSVCSASSGCTLVSNPEVIGQCVPNSGCKTDSDCTAVGGVCNGYVAATNSPTSTCLHWEKNMSNLNTSLSQAELQGCVNSLSYSGIPSVPSFAPTYAGEIANSATSFWNGIFFRSCTYNEGPISGYGDVYRVAISTPATSCVTQTSNGVPCTSSTCKFVPPYSTSEVIGQCGCKANSDCGNANLCAGSVAPSVGYCNGTYTSTVTTPGTCRYIGQCGDPGCSSYTTSSSCNSSTEGIGQAGECNSFTTRSSQPNCAWTDGQTSYPQYNCSLSFSTPSSCNAQYGCSWIDPISAVPGQCVQPTTSLRIDGSCKQYISVGGYSSQPATSTALGCDAGVYQDAADTNVYWNWKCLGLNGGESKLCSTVPLNSQPGQEDYGWCCENTQDQSVSEWCYPCS